MEIVYNWKQTLHKLIEFGVIIMCYKALIQHSFCRAKMIVRSFYILKMKYMFKILLMVSIRHNRIR